MNRCVTIYTDASVCGETSIGGWACWIKFAPGNSLLVNGVLKDKTSCSTQAEMKAIANGIFIALKHILEGESRIIVIVTDSQNALDALTSKFLSKKRNTPLKVLAARIHEMIPAAHTLKVNKVKAHARNDGKRSYTNSLVDKAARTAMRKARAGKAA